MFKSGDYAFDLKENTRVRILERVEMWGYVSYKVYNQATGKEYRLNEEQLGVAEESLKYDENYLRYVALLTKIKNETASGFLSALASGIIPLPHQIHVLNRALATNNIRYILADEVGLGKTIEAGMIIKELKSRGLVKRVLVVCPTGLVTQWSEEMKEKFHEKFQVILPSDYETIKRLTDSEDIYGQYDQVISPMDSIKPIEKHAGWSEERVEKYNKERIYAIINSGWDLVIIDEAHRVAGSSSDVARYKLGSLLAQASPYILLLSATPHNGKTDPFLRLVRLLDEEAFPNAKSIVKEQVAPYLIRSEKREAIDNNGRKLFKKRITNLVELEWDSRHTLQRKLYEMVSDYVAKTYDKARRNRKKNMCLIFLLIIMQRMVTSSTAAVLQSLTKRLEILKNQSTQVSNLGETELLELNAEDDISELLEAVSLNLKEEIIELEDLISLAKQASYQHPDVKLEKLTDILENILLEDKEQKIIIFTEFVATQKYLQEYLESKGFSTTILNGSMSIEERNEALNTFRNTTNIFISTDAGGEGLNLQFSNIIINYDLPWNPMKIEQRCGRVDRIGQQRDVLIYNFIVRDTVENRIREVLETKLSVILDELGVDKYADVLDSETAAIDFTNLYINSVGKPHLIDENMWQVEKELKTQVDNAQKYKSIIHEEKDLQQLVGQKADFDIDKALRHMLTYYEKWQGKTGQLVDRLSINDADIVKHLRKALVQEPSEKLMSVAIDDFPNEEGYFMLWELSISEDDSGKRILPIFVNKDYVLRPIAGQKILEVFLNPQSKLHIQQAENVTEEEYSKLEHLSMDFAYESFVKLKDSHLKKNQEAYNKYMYALKLRKEAAEHIGIDNIRQYRLARLEEEKKTIESTYSKGGNIYPDFCLMLLLRLEA